MRRKFDEKTASIDDFVEALEILSPGARFDVRQPKNFRWRVHFLATPHLRVCTGQNNGEWTCAEVASEERFTLMLPTVGAFQAATRQQTQASTGAHALILADPDPVVFSGRGNPENAQIGINWQHAAYREVLARIYDRDGASIFPQPRFDLRSMEGQLLHFMARGIAAGHFEEISGSPNASALISEAMLRLIIEGSNLGGDSIFERTPADASSRQVRAAIDLMNERLHEPLTLSKLAEELGISGRSLQQGFRRYQDTTPLTYLRRLRLEAVHRELSNPQNELPVNEVAAKWGFAHLGRMAKLYRASYAMSPSETLRRAKSRR